MAGQHQKLFLGNLEARRDWGFAPEYVEGMWRMLQQEESQDLVFGTGETHSVQEFVEEAFGYVNLDWRDYVAIDPRYLRPTEVPLLQADPSEAKRRLGWEAQVRFKELVRIMMDADLEAAGVPAPAEGKRHLADGQFGWLRRP
jgi:GDPmannose 4,6-dehydratase